MWILVFVVVFLILAFAYTIWVGMSQNPKLNNEYVQGRAKTVITLIIIYIVAILVGLALVWLYL